MNKPKWTAEQLRGIETAGRSLLVSAAAGSGKTAVLAARCAHLVIDATPPCDVDQLLVVTFTEAAAAEMKGRIESVLRERLTMLDTEDDPRLVRQLALIERAQVSTLHGFCSRLLRQNFHLLGLDPAFSMLDGDEAKLLRYCSDGLPAFKAPKRIVLSASLPKNERGKLDRRALAERWTRETGS